MNEMPELDPSLHSYVEDAVRTFLRDPEVARAAVERSELSPRPLVLDANRLRGELRTLARSQRDTALTTLARTGFVQLFAARHVVEEVERYLDRWAAETRTPLESYRNAWGSGMRPLIVEVSFPLDLLTPDELARIEVLDRPAPAGDPDDVPTAAAAMVLAAPLLSADAKPLRAVYGPAVDLQAQNDYVEALFAAGRLLVLSQLGRTAFMLVWAIGGIIVSVVRALTARVGLLPLAFGTAAAALVATSTDRSRARLARFMAVLSVTSSALKQIYALYAQAEAAYKRLETPLAPDLDSLAPRVRSARVSAREEAVRRAADVVATGLAQADGSA